MHENYYKNSPDNVIINNITSTILKNHKAKNFHKSLKAYESTPLIQLPELSSKFNIGNIFVKDESSRFGLNAFKVLGASYAINQTLEKNPSIEIFCTATDGNHGRAVAWSAKKAGKKAVVYVPKYTTLNRIEAIKNEGAKVFLVNGNYDDACNQAKIMSLKNNWTLIQDMAWDGYDEIPAIIMSGYLTMFEELEEDLRSISFPKIDIVFLQAGVGSMAGAGVFYYLNKYGAKRPKIVIVEPEEADGILLSFKNNKIMCSRGSGRTIMAGLNCATPSTGAWDLLKSGTDYSLKIHDQYALQAMQTLYFPTSPDKRIISGESGAGGLAGFLAIMNEGNLKTIKESLEINNKTTILFINTEGDTDKQWN